MALAKILLRATDRSDAADALDDAHGGWSLLRAARHRETALGRAIAEELGQRLGGTSGALRDDLRAAAQDIADLLSRVAENENAVIKAATYPDEFFDYAMKHGGDQKRRLISQGAEHTFDRVLEVAAAEFAALLRHPGDTYLLHLQRSFGGFLILR
jgi:hypothetical protein